MKLLLVMIDECGDEVELKEYNLQLNLDEDELAIWKERKIFQASREYPEAIDFYFENRSNGAFFGWDDDGTPLYWGGDCYSPWAEDEE